MSGEATTNMKQAWEKILEYASSPLQGTMSRKLRKEVSVQINDGKVYAEAILFMDERFIRITEKNVENQDINTYYDFDKIVNIRTYGPTY